MRKLSLRPLKVSQLLCTIVIVCDFAICSLYNGCYDVDWTYYGPSHSCFKLFKIEDTWKNALQKCQCYARSWGACYRGNLAVIPDKETNDFLKRLLPDSNSLAYVGLYKDDPNEPERWTGSNVVPTTYEDFTISPSRDRTYYTYLRKDGWHASRGAYRLQFFCQAEARNKPMTIKCPDPVRVSLQPLTISFVCTFDFIVWNKIEWKDSSDSGVAACSRTDRCASSLARIYTASLASDNKRTLLTYKGEIYRQLEGPWSCSIFDELRPTDKMVDTKSCDMKVYEPAEDISCGSEVTSNWVLVTCTVEKIYPQAKCYWKYRTIDEEKYNSAVPAAIIPPVPREFSDDTTGFTYYKTQCQLNMSRETTTFTTGTLIVNVRVEPVVGNFLVPSGDRRFQQTSIVITKPGTPIFKFTNDTVIESRVIAYLEGERVRIVCEVPGGTPVVYQTTMSCTFDIDDAGSKSGTSRGIRYTLDVSATRKMNPGTCSCWGHHITTPTVSSEIYLRIWLPSEVTSFRSKPLNPLEGEKVTLTCLGSGEPEPQVGISTSNKDVEITDKMSNNTLSVSFTADCQSIGLYTCRSQNVINGQMQTVFKDLKLAVKCPPTTCGGHHHIPSFVTRLLQEVQIKLCAHGFPLPDMSKFVLYKAVAVGSGPDVVSDSFYSLEMITEDRTLEQVKITFRALTPTDMGEYQLFYPKTENLAYSYLKFKLASQGPPICSDNFSVEEVGEDYVILTWTPGYSYTGKQTVELLSVSSPPSSVVLSTFEKVEVQGDEVITHKLSGLKPDTDYWIGFDTINEDGLSSCPDSTVNVTTYPHVESANPSGRQIGSDSTPIAVGVFLGLLVIVTVVFIIGFVLWKRKKKQHELQTSREKKQATDAPSPYPTLHDSHTYSNHGEATRMCESSSAGMNGTSDTPAESSAYDTLLARESNVYSNTSTIKDDHNEVSDSVYNNCPEPAVDSLAQQKSIRKRKQKELLYVDVIINPTNQRPEFTEKASPAKKEEESVEYVSIDPVATRAKQNEIVDLPPEEDEED